MSPECVCHGLDFSPDCVDTNTVSIQDQRNFRGAGYQLKQQLHTLRHQLGGGHAHAGQIAVKTGHEAICNRVRAPNEQNRNFRGCVFRRLRRR